MTGISGLQPVSWAAAAPRSANSVVAQAPKDTFTTSEQDFRPINLRDMLSLTQSKSSATALSSPSPKQKPSFQSGSDCGAQSCHRRPGEKQATLSKEDTLNYLQTMLDVGGCIPVLSTPLGLVSALISASRGNTKEALLNLAGAIPVVGVVGKAGLMIKGMAAMKGGMLAAKAGIAHAGMGAVVTGGQRYSALQGMAFSETVRLDAQATLVSMAKQEAAKHSGQVNKVGSWLNNPPPKAAGGIEATPSAKGAGSSTGGHPDRRWNSDGDAGSPTVRLPDNKDYSRSDEVVEQFVQGIGTRPKFGEVFPLDMIVGGVEAVIKALREGNHHLTAMVHASKRCPGVPDSEWQKVKEIAAKIIQANPQDFVNL